MGSHNKNQIRAVALREGFPAEVLAGVCWIEAGGDPMLIDRVAFEVRSFDWSGPGWMDRNMTSRTRRGGHRSAP